jgi:D,D-heptose 1,7-bisphosphate phosphatase
MFPVAGKPILEHQLELAKRYGFKEFIILVGHLGEQIKDYFGDGSNWGVHIDYYHEQKPLGSAGCLKEIENLIQEDFFVFFGDTIMDVDLLRFYQYHKAKKAVATLFVHPNDHPYDSDLVVLNESNKVEKFYFKPHENIEYYRNLVNAALFIFSPQIFNYIKKDIKQNMEKDVLAQMVDEQQAVYGYISTEYIKDMGTPDRLAKVEKDIFDGKVARRNLKNKRPAIFLDRDGVINKEVDLLYKLEDMLLLPNAAEAIKKINQSDYLAVIVTNQPVIARNLVSLAELAMIHNKMETLLGREQAYIDALYFCPHHPDSGYPEERKEYKIACKCRKPKPGMLLQAAKELNIDLTHSYIIGDRESDVLAGKAAGVKTIIVKSNGEIEYNSESAADYKYDNLGEAVNFIIGENN